LFQNVNAASTLTIRKNIEQNNYSLEQYNRPPIAANDTFIFFTGCDQTFTGSILTNDYDPDGDPFHIYFAITPKEIYVEMDDEGNFEIKVPENFQRIVEFEYIIIEETEDDYKALGKVYIQILHDFDCDDVPDLIDLDNDNDGITNEDEGNGLIDSDFDHIPDNLDIDSDNDGITDNVEWQTENDYRPPLGIDLNKNGWDDAYDTFAGGVYYTAEDTNFDGVPDMLDLDTDDDGIDDSVEAFDLNNDGFTDVKLTYSDRDRDGLDDAFDTIDCWSEGCNSTGSKSALIDFNQNGVRDWRDYSNQFHESSNFIFPNPIVESFKIFDPRIQVNSSVAIQIYTIDGKLILQKQIKHTANAIKIPELNTGIYVISIHSETFDGTQKIIVKKNN
jgi:hypothetical protein